MGCRRNFFSRNEIVFSLFCPCLHLGNVFSIYETKIIALCEHICDCVSLREPFINCFHIDDIPQIAGKYFRFQTPVLDGVSNTLKRSCSIQFLNNINALFPLMPSCDSRFSGLGFSCGLIFQELKAFLEK